MSTTLKNIILLIILVVLAFAGYYFFFAKKKAEVSTAGSSSQQSSSGSNRAASVSGADGETEVDEGIVANEEYLKQLIAYREINFNRAMFDDDAYKILQVSNTDIPEEEKGRPNPFAPLDQQYGGESAVVASSSARINSTSRNRR